MALKKIMIAVNCDDDEQARAVQNVMAELCSNVKIDAVDILALYPTIKKNRGLIKDLFRTVSKEGKMGAIRLIPSLIKAFS